MCFHRWFSARIFFYTELEPPTPASHLTKTAFLRGCHLGSLHLVHKIQHGCRHGGTKRPTESRLCIIEGFECVVWGGGDVPLLHLPRPVSQLISVEIQLRRLECVLIPSIMTGGPKMVLNWYYFPFLQLSFFSAFARSQQTFSCRCN